MKHATGHGAILLQMVTATFRFYEELNDFLARPLRRREFSCACARGATAKHMIEVLGVPHTEVELILVNGESVGFNHPLSDGDRIAVYPKFEALDIQPLLRVRERPLRVVRFIADAHLGGLAPLCGSPASTRSTTTTIPTPISKRSPPHNSALC